MTTQEILRAYFEERSEKYITERKRCQREFSNEAIHDLRVAARRMLALIDMLRALMPDPDLKLLRRNFKEQLNSLDDLRDTQVMLAEISERIETLPVLAPLQKHLIKHEKKLLKLAAEDVRAFKSKAISRQIKSTRVCLGKPASLDISERMLTVIDAANAEIHQRIRHVNPSQPASIHHVRIAFKKFRYMIEIIHPGLSGFPGEQFKRMHDYQGMMGEVQDVEVMLLTIENYANRHAGYDLQPARAFYVQHHKELINIFMENMPEFTTFWRPTALSPFPWEKETKETA